MGWLLPDERAAFIEEHGVEVDYICNNCSRPILSVPWIDKKGGYYHFPKDLPKNVRVLTARPPKVTYHYRPCGLKILGKHLKTTRMRKAMNIVLDRLMKRAKPSGYWTKEKIVSKLKGTLREETVRKAVSRLREEGQLTKKHGGYLVKR